MLELVAMLEANEGPLGYLMLAAASLIEYVLPPFPGDTVALGGVFLAATADWSPVHVHLALTAGSIVGGTLAWSFGRWLATRRERSSLLQGPTATRLLDEVQRRFDRHGPAYLVINRFLPALRAFFFVGAGLAGMRVRDVVLWGGLSAALWNAVILVLGYSIGENLELLERIYRSYSGIILALVVVGFLVWGLRRTSPRKMR